MRLHIVRPLALAGSLLLGLTACGTLDPLGGTSDTPADSTDDDDKGDDGGKKGDDDDDDDDDWPSDTDDIPWTDTGSTTDDPQCLPPNVPMSSGTGSGFFDPWYVSLGMLGVLESGHIVDFKLDGVDTSSAAIFTFYDSGANSVCFAAFDADVVTVRTAGTPTDTGLPLWEAYLLNLNSSPGNTNCPLILGSMDVRTWVKQFQWGIGFGPLSADLAGRIQGIVGASEWNTTWQPYIFGSYVYVGGITGNEAWEMGFGFRYPHTCYDVDSTSDPLLKPNGTFNAYFETGEYYILNMHSM